MTGIHAYLRVGVDTYILHVRRLRKGIKCSRIQNVVLIERGRVYEYGSVLAGGADFDDDY